MEIRVIGPGCARCRAAFEESERAAALVQLPVTVVKVEDLHELIAYRAMTTPAIVVDGVLRCCGRVPRASEIAGWLTGDACSRGDRS